MRALNTYARFSYRYSRFNNRQQRRTFSKQAETKSVETSTGLTGKLLAGAGIAGLALFWLSQSTPAHADAVDLKRIREDILTSMEDIDWDDGSWGPILLRLCWHNAGTYSKAEGDGGSDGANIRFPPERNYGANAGLHLAMERLESIKQKYPEISYADLYTFAGYVAIEAMEGPRIPFRLGRSDSVDASNCTPDGRLPDASQGQGHLRDIFYRMGFNDQEIVALSGAHALGRCHVTRSGYHGPWTRSPVVFSNDYFVQLLEQNWVIKEWDGPKQYVDEKTGQLMMLPTDIALIKDPAFKDWVEKYAADETLFFEHFASAFRKLTEAGVNFDDGWSC